MEYYGILMKNLGMKGSDYLKDKYVSFNKDEDFVYNLKTEKGIFNWGLVSW